jgi:hypothetical protein
MFFYLNVQLTQKTILVHRGSAPEGDEPSTSKSCKEVRFYISLFSAHDCGDLVSINTAIPKIVLICGTGLCSTSLPLLVLASISSPLLVKGVVEVYTMISACSKLPYPIYTETDIKINKDLAVSQRTKQSRVLYGGYERLERYKGHHRLKINIRHIITDYRRF